MLYNSISLNILNELTEEMLSLDNGVGLYVGGNSMYPHLRRGDYVHISKKRYELLNVGDIIVFRGLQKYVAHRIIRKEFSENKLYYITKGDSCKKEDNPVRKENYFGKIISFERKGKTYHLENRFFRSYHYFLAFISPYTPVIYSLLRFLKHLFK